MTLLCKLPNNNLSLKSQNLKEGEFITVLVQLTPGEINQISPINVFDVYYFTNNQLTQLWIIRSLNDYIDLLNNGDSSSVTNANEKIEMSHIFYHKSLPKENLDEFVRRINESGITIKV